MSKLFCVELLGMNFREVPSPKFDDFDTEKSILVILKSLSTELQLKIFCAIYGPNKHQFVCGWCGSFAILSLVRTVGVA